MLELIIKMGDSISIMLPDGSTISGECVSIEHDGSFVFETENAEFTITKQ